MPGIKEICRCGGELRRESGGVGQPQSAEAKLEWQFYVDELKLILVQDGKQYVSIDDPNRVFRIVGSGVSRDD